jgi:hypothetical protein
MIRKHPTKKKGDFEMKKLILTSMLASVAMFAQSGTAPAAPAAPAQGQTQTQSKPKVHRHKKGAKPGASSAAPANKPATPATPSK